jgi:hypothetical protein
MAGIREYKVSIPAEAIKQTRQKLALARLPGDMGADGDDWKRGVPVADLKRIAKYWQDEFKWFLFEDCLN